MERTDKKGAAPKGDDARSIDQLAGRIDGEATDLRRGVQAISTPREAVAAMLDAGAVFTIYRRADCFDGQFTYRVAPGGSQERARAILAMAKAKPPPYMTAFRAEVAKVAGTVE